MNTASNMMSVMCGIEFELPTPKGARNLSENPCNPSRVDSCLVRRTGVEPPSLESHPVGVGKQVCEVGVGKWNIPHVSSDLMVLFRTQRYTALACTLLLIASVSTQADDLAEYRKHLTLFSLKTAGPVLDGRLDDPCWNNAHVQTARGFVLLMDEGEIELPAADTEVMSCYDDTHLYIAAKLHEPGMDKLKVSTPVQPWMGDCIEVFVDPTGEGRNYFQFVTGLQWTDLGEIGNDSSQFYQVVSQGQGV